MVQMIRNYQRAGGGGNVDLGPVYNSLNALQNEINSLITLTQLSTLTSIGTGLTELDVLSTAFTSHTSLYASKFNTLESIVTDDSGRIDSLSSSVMDINGIISTLSTATGGGGGGDITLTNPTETANHLFTDPVLYTGDNALNSNFQPASNISNNTYMKGVTWRDAPGIPGEYGRALPAWFEGCAIYGDMSIVNVDELNVSNCTISSFAIHTVTGVNIESGGTISSLSIDNIENAILQAQVDNVTVNNASSCTIQSVTVNDIRLSKCTKCSIVDAYMYHLHPLNVTNFSLYSCRVKDMSMDYTTTIDTLAYGVYLLGNTIDKINASAISVNVFNNDIWTANFYMDYDLMHTDIAQRNVGTFAGNTINELSIFDNDHGWNTAAPAIVANQINVESNSIRRFWYDLYCPLVMNYCTIETIENTLGMSLAASRNYIQEWDCEVTPYSAQLHNTSTTGLIALISSNTVGKWNFYHGLSANTFTSNSTLSTKIVAALDKLAVSAIFNSVNYMTVDVLNPLSVNLVSDAISAQFNVANDMTLAISKTIGTLNVVKNERFITDAQTIMVRAFSAHSMGLTNIYPLFNAAGGTIDKLDMFIDDSIANAYSLSNITIGSAHIRNLASTENPLEFKIKGCSMQYLNYEQRYELPVNISINTINYCRCIGGGLNAISNRHTALDVNINSGGFRSNTALALCGICQTYLARENSFNVGGFYYSSSQGSGDTIVRLNTAF